MPRRGSPGIVGPRHAVGRYFAGIWTALKNVGEGMAVTMSWLLRRPITVQYPDRYDGQLNRFMRDLEQIDQGQKLPLAYRGFLEVDMDVCTACQACERACPIDCIAITIDKVADERRRVMTRFDIDLGKCMYCGLCVDPCPTAAIQHTPEFEATSQYVENLVARFVPDPRRPCTPYKIPKGQQIPRKPLGSVLRELGVCGPKKDPFAPLPPFSGARRSFGLHAAFSVDRSLCDK